MATPEATAIESPVVARIPSSPCPVWLIRTIATIASSTPIAAGPEGRSPRASPTISGTTTAQTAVTGATTLITPIARPR